MDLNSPGVSDTRPRGRGRPTPCPACPLGELVTWMLSQCQLPAQQEDGLWVVDVPEPLQPQLGAERIRCSLSDEESDQVWSAAPGGRLFQWLTARLEQSPPQAMPAGQPEGVHMLVGPLFDAFQLDDGALRLGGCSLSDKPFLRLTFVSQSSPDGPWQVRHAFYWASGEEVDPRDRTQLGLDDLVATPRHCSRVDSADMQRWLKLLPQPTGGESERLVLRTVVWCTYAQGQLTAVHGSHTLSLPFAGWAKLIADGQVKPPPYCDEATGVESYHLVALDDGQLTAAEAVGVCEESGARVRSSDLVRCAATGRLALPEHFETCPVTGDQVLRQERRQCAQCQQEVSPTAVDSRGICQACQSLAPVSKDDPRMARVLGEYPGLDVWRRWRISETAASYVLSASALLRRLLVVVDKESLRPQYVATRFRFSNAWQEPPAMERAELLSGRPD